MEWRMIISFPSYEVSERGDVRWRDKDKPVKGFIHRSRGYRAYNLRHEGYTVRRFAHQLVLEAFVGPRPFPDAETRHLDGDRTNNHHTNLQWGTTAENYADAVRHGTRKLGH